MNKKRSLFLGSREMVECNLLDHPKINRFDLLAPNRKEDDLTHFSDLSGLIYLVFNYIINSSVNIHCA